MGIDLGMGIEKPNPELRYTSMNAEAIEARNLKIRNRRK